MPGSELVYRGARRAISRSCCPLGLGVRLADGALLGCRLRAGRSRNGRRSTKAFEQFPGKRRLVTDRCNETTLTLRERGEPRRRWQVVVRAYDDGVALRYRFPVPGRPGRNWNWPKS